MRSQAALIKDLLNENYQPARPQSDQLEKRFFQYRQMSGGNFLASLKEVQDTEKTQICRSLLKEQIDLWEKGLSLKADITPQMMDILNKKVEGIDADDILLDNETPEVGIFIAGYIAKKINKKTKRPFCNLLVEELSNNSVYFNHLSRGALTFPSPEISDFVCKSFGFLDYFKDFIVNHKSKSVRLISSTILRQKLTINFACDLHKQKVQDVVISIVEISFLITNGACWMTLLKVILYPALESDNVLNKLRLITKCAYFSISVYFSNFNSAYFA